MKVYQQFASAVNARLNCIEHINSIWEEKWTTKIHELTEEFMPSGSGFDAGTILELEESTGEKLVFTTSFHHMDEHGFYDGWTEHKVIVTPSLQFGFNLRVTGRDQNEIKDYIAEVFQMALSSDIPAASEK